MKTIYKPQQIVSPFQNHPVRAEINKNLGTYELTATFQEDTHTLQTLKGIPGVIAFLCILKHGNQVLSEGRGMAVLNKINKYFERGISAAKGASLLDAVAKAMKILDFLPIGLKSPEKVEIGDAYKSNAFDAEEPATNKQKSYLRELIHINVEDEREREMRISELEELTKSEASTAIAEYAR